jgi:hypothetical protein
VRTLRENEPPRLPFCTYTGVAFNIRVCEKSARRSHCALLDIYIFIVNRLAVRGKTARNEIIMEAPAASNLIRGSFTSLGAIG